ncbi:MAG: hypothetical protein ACO29Q_08175, partial [Crocinitomicaceae bacterium]
MKNFILFFSLIFSLSFVQGQGMMNNYIKWTYSVEKIDESHANLVMSAKIVAGFHVFSLKHNPADADGTGIVPEFTFKKGTNYRLVGKPFETGTPKKHVDDLGTSYYFENKATYKQQIEVLSSDESNVTVGLFFQMCNEEGCLPPFDTEGKFKLSGFTANENASLVTGDTSTTSATDADTSKGAKTQIEPSKTNDK